MGFCSKHYKRWRRGTISADGIEIKKKPRCRVADCPEERHMGGYCEQHFNRLLLMKELWVNKIMPIHSNREAIGAGNIPYYAKIINLADISADLDRDYSMELERSEERK